MIEMSIAGPKVNQLAVAGSEHKLAFRLCQLSVGEHHDLPSAEPIPANSQGAARNRAGY
jgi:hypothetical protein